MRGIKDFNFPAFFVAEQKLKEEGHTVFNPAQRDVTKCGMSAFYSAHGDLEDIKHLGFSLRDSLGTDTAWICEHAEAIALLPDWEKSKGAKAEKALAEALSLEIRYL